MINALKLRIKHNDEVIKNLNKVNLHKSFRGLPLVNPDLCNNCQKCVDICPANAITLSPLSLDLGKCVLCGECSTHCINKAIQFTIEHRLSSTQREHLIIKNLQDSTNYLQDAIKIRKEIINLFGKSLKLREVSAGGCNGCELELNASSNINFDIGRYGVEFVASPRHADGIVITGPITNNMADALDDTWEAIPEPKIVILVGACAISSGIFYQSEKLNRRFLDTHKIDLFIPGCPVHPMTFISGIMDFLGSKRFKSI